MKSRNRHCIGLVAALLFASSFPGGDRMLSFNSRPVGRRRTRDTAFIVPVIFIMMANTAHAGDWPQWGGPNRDFKIETSGLADRWPEEGPKRLWSRPLGEGYSSIAAADGRLFTMYRDGEQDVIVSLRADTGKTVWDYKYAAPTVAEHKLDFGKGPNATPLLVGDRLITVGFTGKLNCVSVASGKPIWSHDLVEKFGGKIQEFGYSASPILYEGKVIVLVGGEMHGVLAFDPKSGFVAWGSEAHDISYASPVIINVDGQDQIVFMSSTEVIGLDAKSGETLWRHPCVNRYKNNASDPIWGEDNLLWIATQLDGGARVLELKQRDGKTSVQELWFNKKVKIFHWNAVRVGDHVYASIGNNTSVLAAVDIKTGKIAWRERGFHKALCVYADRKLIFLDENGQLGLAKIAPEGIEILSKVQLTEKVSWTVPTLAGKTLYVRDNKNIMALDLGEPG